MAVEGKFPVLLERTPYGKGARSGGHRRILRASRICRRRAGRARAAISPKATGVRSCDDPNDGSDTAAWIGAQPWCDGGIGTMGTSYDGATQHALAIGNAPFVKAMVPRNAMSDFGRYGVRHNGAFELRWLNWVLTMGNAIPEPPTLPRPPRARRPIPPPQRRSSTWAPMSATTSRSLPLRPGTTPLKFAPDYEAWLIEAMSHGDYDAFWKDHGSSVVDHLAEYKDVPEYHTTGWYDSWGTPVANLNFVELRKAKKSLQRLIVGPWIHSSENISYAGEAQFTADAALDLAGLSPALVRPLAQGHRQRSGPRTARAHLRDGRRRRAQDAGGTPLRRRPLARRTGVAAGARRGDALLSARERRACRRTSPPRARPPPTCSIRETRCPRSAEIFPRRAR